MSEGSVPLPPETSPSVAKHALPKTRLWVLFALPVLLMVLAWGTGGVLYVRHLQSPTETNTVVELDGSKLFAQHCASCHGSRGDGKGVAVLEPSARYFGKEKYKLASTVNGIPTDDDLMRIIRHGIPGSAMPGFADSTINDEQCLAIISQVRSMTRRGIFEQLYAKALKDYDDGGDDPNPAQISQKVEALAKPGDPLNVPNQFHSSNPEGLANGRKIYLTSCAGCHGPEGRGDGPQVKEMKNENGTPNRPRDLTAGLFKGGGEPAKLYTRIRLAIPGTPIPATPATTVPDKDVNDLINYVLSLSAGKAAPTTTVATAGK